MTRKEKIRFLILRSIGNFLILISLYGVIMTFGPVLTQEVRFRFERSKGVTYIVKSKDQVTQFDKPNVVENPGGLGELVNSNKVHILIPIDTEFSILIPRIGATAKIYPNVNPEDETEFREVLKSGIAHARGTVFPGIPGNTYLFAHSTDNWWNVGRYNAVFYLLKDLEKGDEVVVFFENRRYNYTVSEKYLADPTEVSLLQYSHGVEEKLVLQTCWPPGTTWKRLFIIAKPK